MHLTLKIDGSIEAGPNAILATSREGYTQTNFNAVDCWQCLKYAGFWRMVGRYWKTGLMEAYRSCSKQAFTRELQRLVPSLTAEDLHPGGAGVRAQVVMPDGSLCDDFLLIQRERAIHVLNAPSPAATASLAIGQYISAMTIR